MIVEMSSQFDQITPEEWLAKSALVENLLQSHVQGWHIFAPSRSIGQNIIDYCDLSGRMKDIFTTNIFNRLSVILGEARSCSRTVCVAMNGNIPDFTNQTIINESFFLDLANCGPIRLLVEHFENDGEFFTILFSAFARHFKYRLPRQFEIVHGGGQTISNLYRHHWNDIRPLICIVDSDKLFPDDNLGGTAQSVVDVGLVNATGTVMAIVLPMREAENLLPISFLLDVFSDNAGVQGQIGRYRQAVLQGFQAGSLNPYDFIDLKRGTTVAELTRVPNSEIQPYLQFIGICGTDVCRYADLNDLDPDHVALPAISANLLPSTLAYLTRNAWTRSDFIEKLCKLPRFTELAELFEEAIALALASQKLPVAA